MKSPCPTRMTLEDLTKSAVHLILGVREGHGFGFLNCPLVVVAGLDGHRLETDIIPPSGDPIFAIELVWEADIKNIRRLRQANTPVKIECYSVVNSQKRDRIGYILLSLKQAQIVPQGKKVTIIESWHRLLGVRSEMKTLNPEMLLTLRIEDSADEPSDVDSGTNQAITDKVSSNLLKPLLYADEGVIQIGSYEYCSDIFKLKMSIGFSRILKSLLPDVKKYGKQSQLSDIFENFTLCYTLLGYSMQTQIKLNELKEKDGRSGLDFDESAVIVVRSNLKMLKAYFNEYPTVLFRLVVDNTELATSTFSLKGLVLTDDVLQFKDEKGGYVESRCFLQPTNRNETSSVKPYIDVAVKLSFEISSPGGGYGDSKKSGSKLVKPVPKCEGYGDNSTLDNVAVVETILSPRQRSLQITNPECVQSVLSVEVDKVVASSNTLNPDCAESKDDVNQKGSYTYRCNRDPSVPHGFTLYLVLKSITFRKLPPVGKFTFRMHHPLAEVVCALHGEIRAEKANEKICLPPIEAEFRFTASSDEINNILMTEQPTITVSDVNNKVFCRAVVQTGMLLSTHKNKECAYTASLEGESVNSRTSKKQFGLLHIIMSLKDCGIVVKPACNSVVSTVSGVNTRVAYRVVEELEDWKERQQQIFKSELKRKECQHLTMLSSEWTKRRMELEDNLNRNVEQCRSLAHSLNEATDNMRERSRKNSEKERTLLLAEKELERKFELKFQELKEATQRMEADVNHKMSLMKYEKAELLLKIEQMEHEKKHLLQNIQSLETDLDAMRSGGLTKDQAAGLIQEMKSLEEKLEAAHESKLFFKEQWGKAVREIHRLKKEHQHAVQAQLQKEKDDLHKFQIIQQAKEEERQMVRDKSVLKNMKIETQDLSNVLQNQQQLSQQNANGSQFMTPCLDLNNVQLQRLIDQRDQLLNSGAATNREMLAALNNQIRTLLLQMSN